MSDNEIKKALEKMTYGGHSCMHCKYGTTKDNDRCGLQGCKIGRDALDLINRQQAEIERLQKAKADDVSLAYKVAKTEAIKEFAKKVKKTIIDELVVDFDDIDNLVAEMTESPTKIEHSSLCETDTYEVKE